MNTQYLVGIYDGNSFYDSFVIDGYQPFNQLVKKLSDEFSTESSIIDMLNYFDSDGNGSRYIHSLELIPSVDFVSTESFVCKNVNDFVKFANSTYDNTIVWKNGSWWIYDTTNNVCRRVK